MKVLLVEDDVHLGESLQSALTHAGYACDWVGSVEDAGIAMKTSGVDIVVLDWSLPDGNGPDFLKAMRRNAVETPVILLTARTQLEDKVTGLDAGADDYLAKPFELDELLARLRSLGRRRTVRPSSVIETGSLFMDPASYEVRDGGEPLQLNRSEFQVLRTLAEHAGTFMPKSRMMDHLYDWNEDITPNAIEAQISRVRKKLIVSRVTTLRGVGYRLEKDPS